MKKIALTLLFAAAAAAGLQAKTYDLVSPDGKLKAGIDVGSYAYVGIVGHGSVDDGGVGLAVARASGQGSYGDGCACRKYKSLFHYLFYNN